MYGDRDHEEWLIELERTDVPDERPDQPWTPCGCTARAYGGDCAHTTSPELENELAEGPCDCGKGEWCPQFGAAFLEAQAQARQG